MARVYNITDFLGGLKMSEVNVFDVAKYILQKQKELTTMKLQKLVYYSQAWSLVWDEKELFLEDFQAWANGPVCPELFNTHRGLFTISKKQLKRGDLSKLNIIQRETIDSVLNYYGDKPAHWLSMLTHKERPWLDVREGIPEGENCNNIITKESMCNYYGSLQ